MHMKDTTSVTASLTSYGLFAGVTKCGGVQICEPLVGGIAGPEKYPGNCVLQSEKEVIHY